MCISLLVTLNSEINIWAAALVLFWGGEIIQCAFMVQILMIYLIFPDKRSQSGFYAEMIETDIKNVESRKVR